jgi:cephalosporin hydroxylase
MNFATRAARCAKAYLGLGTLNRQTALSYSNPKQVMALTFDFNGGFLQPLQERDELLQLLGDVVELAPGTVLEIGTNRGGTLYLWTRYARPDATIISVDLPGGAFGGGYPPVKVPLYRSFSRKNQKLHLVRADSHQPSTLARIKALLGGRPLNFLFLDGDHTYEGVKMDWEMYSPLVGPGGIIAFHDVAGNYADTNVKRFWDELKGLHKHREYVTRVDGRFGIGVITKS